MAVIAGHVPDLSGLTLLRTLELSWNKFSGKVPSFRAMSALRVLSWQGPGQGLGLSGGLQPMLRSADSGWKDGPNSRELFVHDVNRAGSYVVFLAAVGQKGCRRSFRSVVFGSTPTV